MGREEGATATQQACLLLDAKTLQYSCPYLNIQWAGICELALVATKHWQDSGGALCLPVQMIESLMAGLPTDCNANAQLNTFFHLSTALAKALHWYRQQSYDSRARLAALYFRPHLGRVADTLKHATGYGGQAHWHKHWLCQQQLLWHCRCLGRRQHCARMSWRKRSH